ncbi:MAG: hypothetical protein J6Q89_02460 [Clostridia bacterium]|nr:hypothetical protein [Clostridia bacterium]
MDKEIIFTPEELYYMGRFLQAKYIDYAYIAAMADIKQNYALFESEVKATLVSAGILMEDFGGDLEVDPNVLSVLKPIFFGETETSIDICNIGETNTVAVFKYHFYDGAITMVTGDNGKLAIKTSDQISIREKVESLISEKYVAENRAVDTIDKNQVTRFMAFKQISLGVTSVVKTYIEADGIFYHEKGQTIESVTREQFVSDAFDIVKGV